MSDSLTGKAAPAPALPSWARWRPDELVLALHVQPGARRTAICGQHGQRLKLALHAPPVEGKANEELLRFLGAQLRLRRSELRLVAGAASREKSVAISAGAEQARRLADLLARATQGPGR